MTMYNTVLLNPATWDLVLDSNRNIAVAQPPYALAQDVASACSLFKGELLYGVNDGIPYLDEVLGKSISSNLMAGYLERAALTVPGVVSAKADLFTDSTRVATGAVQFIDEKGALNNVKF